MSVLFVDESKAQGYTMVAVFVALAEIRDLRRKVRSLVLPGQRRIHFTKESSDRKRRILSRFVEYGVRSQVFHCATKNQARGRLACLSGIVAYAVANTHAKIVLERDESAEKSDRQFLFTEVRRHGRGGALSYTHQVPHQELLLWLADAIAWAHVKGGRVEAKSGAADFGCHNISG